MPIKVSQREYFLEQMPDALPLALLQDINDSFGLNYNLPKQEKKMRKAIKFAKTVYLRTTDTKFAKSSSILKIEDLEVDELEMIKPLSTQLDMLFLNLDITLELVEACDCIHAIGNWCYILKLPLSSNIKFMKGALNEKIKQLNDAAEAKKLLDFANTKLKKEEQQKIYDNIRELERKAKEEEETMERLRAAKRRQAAVEMMDLDLIIIKRVKHISIDVPYVNGRNSLDSVFLPSVKFHHLLNEARGGVYGVAERPELEILEFEYKVYLPPPDQEHHRIITLCFLFDRSKSIFIITKKIQDRLLLYVHQGGKGNLWQQDITLLKSAVCRVDDAEFSTLDVFLQKQWRRFLILRIAPLREDVNRVAYIRDLRELIVKEGDSAMDFITPEGSDSEHSDSSSEDSRARRKRLKKEKRLKKKEAEKKKKKKKKKSEISITKEGLELAAGIKEEDEEDSGDEEKKEDRKNEEEKEGGGKVDGK